MGLWNICYILDIHVWRRRGSQGLSPKLLIIKPKRRNCINFRLTNKQTLFSVGVSRLQAALLRSVELGSITPDTNLPFGTGTDIADLYGAIPHEQGRKCRLCLKKPGKFCTFGSSCAGKAHGMAVDLCRHEARAVPPWFCCSNHPGAFPEWMARLRWS